MGRFCFSLCLWWLLLFSFAFHYSGVSFFILVLLNTVFCADIFVYSAWKDFWRGRVGLSLLVSVAVAAGFTSVLLHTFFTQYALERVPELYLYTSAFLTISLWAQGRRVREQERARIYIKKIDDFLPKAARRLVGSQVRKVFANELYRGDIVQVNPGERFPCDGIITHGKTSIDEQLITGNALPAYKITGQQVYAGTVNKTASVYVEVTRTLEDAELITILAAVQNSELRRSYCTSRLDTFAAWALFFILLVAGAQYGFAYYHGNASYRLLQLNNLLVILGLAPLGVLFAEGFPAFFALRCAKRKGIRVQNRYALAQLMQADTVFFDKTGTLTYGELSVCNVYPNPQTGLKKLLEVAASAEQRVDGPFAAAILKYARRHRTVLQEVDSFSVLPGFGVKALLGSETVWAGRAQWLEEQGIKVPKQVQQETETVICVAQGKRFLGYFVLEDALRDGAAQSVAYLKKLGKEPLLISGDNEPAVAAIAREVGIEKHNFNVLPKTKAEIITNLRALGKKVIMIGDGFNDIVALLQADVGIVFLSGKNTYHNWVDILISRRDLYALVDLFKIDKSIRRTGWFNAVLACVCTVGWIEFLLWYFAQQADGYWTLGGNVVIVLLILLNSMRLSNIK